MLLLSPWMRNKRAVGHLKKHIEALRPDVYAISLSQDGGLVSVSADPKDDETTCVYRPPLRDLQLPGRVKTVLRSDLLELDRLGPNVDLVSYTPRAGTREWSSSTTSSSSSYTRGGTR